MSAYASMYDEGYKPMDQNKMQDKAANKPDTPKGEQQARKIDKVRASLKAIKVDATSGNCSIIIFRVDHVEDLLLGAQASSYIFTLLLVFLFKNVHRELIGGILVGAKYT